ncbi:MAG: hypothetical protein L0154_26430 [Chloroflexi bacterium]|nr:hypothetical protein [Chloroflexota bacterium]
MRFKLSSKFVLLLFACLLLTTIPFLFGVLNQPDKEPAPAVQETIPVTATEHYTPPAPIIIEVGTVEATEIVDTEGTSVASTLVIEATWTRQAMLSATQTMYSTLVPHD